MSSVAVTGAAGPVGRRLVDILTADASVERVVALDRSFPRSFPVDDRIERAQMQLRDGDIDAAFDGVDVVCHLAGSDPLEDRDVDHDLHTTARVLAAAERCGADQVIVRTSATVYGAWNDNPSPMSETSPLRPNDDNDWVRIRAQIEDRVATYARSHPDVAVAVVRPCVTVSPDGPDELGRVLAAARIVVPVDEAAPAQFVHVDDVASAVDTIRRRRACGAFNVAPDGSLDAEFTRALDGGKPRVPLSVGMARRLTAFGWRYQLAPTPPGFVAFVTNSWVVANDRLRSLGWEPTHANEEAFVAGHKAAPWASVSPQRRQEIALGAAGAALVAAAAAGVVAVRRMRSS